METHLVDWILKPKEPGNKATGLQVSLMKRTQMVVGEGQTYRFGPS
jgi:hypothetical protein